MATRSKRRRTEINYARLNEGVLEIAQTHPHTAFFSEPQEAEDAEEPDILAYFTQRDAGPVKIPKRWFSKLGMQINRESFTPQAIAEKLGEETKIPVMDSVTQQGLDGWTLGKWRDYLGTSAESRRSLTGHGTLNLISLEFSGTELENEVQRPLLVAEHDLVDRVWPREQAKPKVRLYSLTSAAHSFTDFHLDFAGTSVFYHVVSGSKSFIFVRPTEANLKAYEKWCNSSDQQSTWFPTTLKRSKTTDQDIFQLDLAAGDSMLIPSGWIHAVYTPTDSSVVGGNFLTQKDMPMQLRINELEKQTKVPQKFRFPQFDLVLQYYDEYLERQALETKDEAKDVKNELN